MLSTQKIADAFEAICEEVKQGLKSIRSIAKHQNDVREAKKGNWLISK